MIHQTMNNIEKYTWIELLFYSFLNVNKTTIKHILAVGGLDYLKIPREQMLFEHDIALKFTTKELDWIKKNLDLSTFKTFEGVLSHILSLPTGRGNPIAQKNRQNILKGLHFTLINPPYSLNNNIERNIALERSFLGVELSAHKLDLIQDNTSDCTVKEFNNGSNYQTMKFMLELHTVKMILTKKTQSEMGFISGTDQTGQMNDIVAFPEAFAKYKNLLFEGNSVLIIGRKGGRDNLIIQEVHQL